MKYYKIKSISIILFFSCAKLYSINDSIGHFFLNANAFYPYDKLTSQTPLYFQKNELLNYGGNLSVTYKIKKSGITLGAGQRTLNYWDIIDERLRIPDWDFLDKTRYRVNIFEANAQYSRYFRMTKRLSYSVDIGFQRSHLLKSNVDMYISSDNIDTIISTNYNNRAYPTGSSISIGMHTYLRIKKSSQKIFWGLVTNYQYKSDREGFYDEGTKPGVIYSYSPFRFQFDVGYCIPL